MKTYRDRLSRIIIMCAGIVVVALSCVLPALGAPFQNLDFESAVIGTPVHYELPASEALPYWSNDHFHARYVAYDMPTKVYHRCLTRAEALFFGGSA
jgi:hypothetical protein